MRYYDSVAGRERIKRRYVWAFWAFGIGLAGGLTIAETLMR
ncbi:hypothetical protein [Solimonas terrae]|nr:hypothetical protein [Solimonas terrae]